MVYNAYSFSSKVIVCICIFICHSDIRYYGNTWGGIFKNCLLSSLSSFYQKLARCFVGVLSQSYLIAVYIWPIFTTKTSVYFPRTPYPPECYVIIAKLGDIFMSIIWSLSLHLMWNHVTSKWAILPCLDPLLCHPCGYTMSIWLYSSRVCFCGC